MEGSNFLSMLLPYGAIIAIFYFLVFRPQKKKQDDHKKMLAGIEKHDQVVTNAGIHGTVVIIKDDTIVVRVDDNCRIEFDRDVISTITKKVNS